MGSRSEGYSQSIGVRACQSGILRGSTGCLKGLTEMVEGYRIWLNQIFISYGTQPYHGNEFKRSIVLRGLYGGVKKL